MSQTRHWQNPGTVQRCGRGRRRRDDDDDDDLYYIVDDDASDTERVPSRLSTLGFD